MLLGGGNVVAGEPQIKLGDFLFRHGLNFKEDVRSIIYAINGDINLEDKERMNNILYSIVSDKPKYLGKMIVHYGISTGYYIKHIKFLGEIILKYHASSEQLELVEHNISSHNDIIPIFMKALKSLNSIFLSNLS